MQAGGQQPSGGPRPSCLQNRHAGSGEGVGSNIDSDTHTSGMEPLTERARNLTEVAHVGVTERARVWVWGAVGMPLGGAAHVASSLQYPHALGHIKMPRSKGLPSVLCCAVLCMPRCAAAQEKIRTEGTGETCTPEVGFPARWVPPVWQAAAPEAK